jgi:hypothetical protein
MNAEELADPHQATARLRREITRLKQQKEPREQKEIE